MAETLTLPVQTLQWAAEKAGLGIDAIAHVISKRDPDKVISGSLTYPQLRKFAAITKQPIGYLFLEAPPEDFELDLPDLRTRKNSKPLSNNFVEVYKDIRFKQEWFKEYLSGIGATELEFVGKYALHNDTKTIADDIRKTIKLDLSAIKAGDIDEYHDDLSRLAEDIGILIFRNGIVKNNTHRALDPDEFLGFAIADSLVPAIFINAADKTAAKIFTLAHELAHIWIGVSGVSDYTVGTEDAIEIKCNSVATELLIPVHTFISTWDEIGGESRDKIHAIRKRFKVSELVVARLAMENGKISAKEYWDIFYATKKFVESKKIKGGNGRALQPIRNSRVFMKTITNLLGVGKISFKEAGMLLNISPVKVGEYVKQQN